MSMGTTGLTADHAAYLRRLGFDEPPPPTLDSLVDLHRAHLDAVPYENLDIMLGRPASTEPAEVVARLGRGGRAGYCFHQNGALGSLLEALGFDVDRRHGHVWTNPDHRFDPSLNHLVLLVRGLPTSDHPLGTWWPDVGLGEGFRDPAPLATGAIRDPGFDFEVTELSDGGWSFRNDPRGTFTALEVRDLDVDVPAAHRELSTAPDSPFRRVLVVQRRQAGGVDTVRGCVASHVGADGDSTRDLTGFGEWREALTDGQRLPLDDVPVDELRALWDRTVAAHRVWVDAGRP
jgi:N-hydroxyarylamine O-acetyltransferase